MDIILTLTSTGAEQGALFDLYSNTDGFVTAYETDVPLASLQGGYTSSAPANTTTVRICGQNVSCPTCVDITPSYTTTTSTTLPPIQCEETANSGGVGVTEYVIPLEAEGGVLVLDFDAYGVPDKLEILHMGVKKATSGMTVDNYGPFDNLYGDPTVPDSSQVIPVDQFIGTQKNVPPTRTAEILADTGLNFTPTGQQLVWWKYEVTDYNADRNATVRVTGPNGTAWVLKRLCDENNVTTTTTTSSTSTTSTTTSTTTAAPTTTTTTTLTGLEMGLMSTSSSITLDCALILNKTIWVDTAIPGTFSVGDIVYEDENGTQPFVGNGDYYKLRYDTEGVEFGARINIYGELLSPMSIC